MGIKTTRFYAVKNGITAPIVFMSKEDAKTWGAIPDFGYVIEERDFNQCTSSRGFHECMHAEGHTCDHGNKNGVWRDLTNPTT